MLLTVENKGNWWLYSFQDAVLQKMAIQSPWSTIGKSKTIESPDSSIKSKTVLSFIIITIRAL